MKIIYFTHYFPPAGFAASLNTYEIVKRLANRGHKILVFCQPAFSKYSLASQFQLESQFANMSVHWSWQTPLLLSVMIPHFLNAFKSLKHEYNLVITQFHPFHAASFAGYLVKALKKKPWIVKVHDIILDPFLQGSFHEKILTHIFYDVFLSKIGKRANKLLVLSSELKSFLEYHGYASEKVAVVPNGVDASFFSPLVSGKKGLSEKTILYIGSMTRDDGLDILIEAFALLEPRSQLKLVLIGKGPERFKLMQLVKKFGLERNVVFLSFVSHEHMPNFIRDAYITVGPLRQSPINHYTIPTKLLEYFACGKATVSVKVSRDVLIDGFNGFIIEKVSPESVAEKLRILIEDEQLAETLGKNGRQLVLERFDWEKIIDAFEKELEDVKP